MVKEDYSPKLKVIHKRVAKETNPKFKEGENVENDTKLSVLELQDKLFFDIQEQGQLNVEIDLFKGT